MKPTAVSTPLSLVEFIFGLEGSTRAAALLRIALPLLSWSAWGSDLILFHNLSPFAALLAVAYWVSTSLMLVGYRSRIATACAGATSLAIVRWLGEVGGRDAFTHHHTSLLAFATIWSAFTPCGDSYSLDRWLAVKRAEARGEQPPEERANQWGMRLIALQLSAVYFWGAVDKTTLAFLSGQRMEAIALQYFYDLEPQRLRAFHPLMIVASVGTVALEYVLAIGLWIPRLRLRLMLAGVAFHALIYFSLPVQAFSFTACVLYLAFLPPDAVHDVIERLDGRAQRAH